MLRSSRTVLSLIRSLMLGTATAVATAAVATSVVGCKDESQPEYWLGKLDDPTWRPRAVKRLEQFVEDALTRSNKDLSAPEVKSLLDKIVDPLTKTYVDNYGDMDTKTRTSLMKLLASTRDPRIEPALNKAFTEFAQRPKSTKDEQDIKWAARAAGDMKLQAVADPMLQAFMKLRASTMLGGIVYRDFNEAMVAISSPQWAGPLRSMLEPEVKQPKNAKDTDAVDAFRDQLFWQTTSAEVLGRIGDAGAVDPLMKVMLDPAKVDVMATALLALVKISKPAMDETMKLLKGDNEKLSSYHARRVKEVTGAKEVEKDAYVATAALILGTIGRQEALPAMIGQLKQTKSDTNKAVIAREITKIPETPASQQAFKEAFETISIDTVVPPGASALQLLAEQAGQFYEPNIIDWLLERAEGTKGGGEDKKALQSVITVTVLKLAKQDQLGRAKLAVDRYGTKLEKDLFAHVDKLVKACGDRLPCYLDAVEKGEYQDQKNQFGGIKAGYMIGILGNEQTAGDLIERLDSIDNAAVRFVAAQTIDHLLPKGSKDAAAKLKHIMDKNLKSADRDKIAGDAPLKQVMYRLEARAQ
jgi:hypothetical protein